MGIWLREGIFSWRLYGCVSIQRLDQREFEQFDYIDVRNDNISNSILRHDEHTRAFPQLSFQFVFSAHHFAFRILIFDEKRGEVMCGRETGSENKACIRYIWANSAKVCSVFDLLIRYKSFYVRLLSDLILRSTTTQFISVAMCLLSAIQN